MEKLKKECAECDIDYRAEDERLKAENEKLKAENEKLNAEISWHRDCHFEMEKMRAQLDIIYLIFGGRNHG